MNAQLQRVQSNIAEHVIEFISMNKNFFAKDLYEHVCSATGCAPASATRILQNLRKEGKINYRVISRSQSYYETLANG